MHLRLLRGHRAGSAPQPVVNRAGLSEIAYRVGDYGRFLASMQARLSSSDYAALARLARDRATSSAWRCSTRPP